MACALTQGFSLDCKDALGGIKNIYIQAYNTVVASGLSFNITTGDVQDLPSGITLYRYEVDDAAGNWNSAGTAEDNGAFVFPIELVVRLRGITSNMRKELQLLARNRVVIFVEPHRGSGYDNKLFALGLYRGLQLTAGGFEHGAGMGDFSGLNLTFSGNQAEAARLVEAYTDTPFDNMGNVPTISPAIVAAQYSGAITES